MSPKAESSSTSDNTNTVLHDQMQTLIRISTATAAKLEQLVNFLVAKESPPPPPPPPPPNNNRRLPKIHLPTFDGSNPLDWIFQAENYFTYYSVLPPQRLSLAVFYFTGDTLSWYKHMANFNLLGNWPEFTRALELRFGPSTYENHQATSAYQTEFEKISNRVIGLSPPTLRNCFISGLRSDIQTELTLHNPETLHQTYRLAKLIEDKLHAKLPSLVASVEPPPKNPPLVAASSPTLPIKRLSPAEIQKRRAKGLCYNCPTKYQSGHQCKPPQFLLLQSETDPPWTSIAQHHLGLDKAIFQGGSIDTNGFG
ncbi:hypothetical protein L2E82_03750 [Cichorium intybus]|uniref:Uncharacterized protein n=1 Tax=Cichorium intybus TaxID=13427 RepID=A0ACB9H5J5_CICIN|nr:hypothetical protein L2E82_03750 [Cichorium intybus]